MSKQDFPFGDYDLWKTTEDYYDDDPPVEECEAPECEDWHPYGRRSGLCDFHEELYDQWRCTKWSEFEDMEINRLLRMAEQDNEEQLTEMMEEEYYEN